ncbi:MAG: imidazole glycerol phosphate synthase subunit HisH [Candidatus Omnitrophota bacterium]
MKNTSIVGIINYEMGNIGSVSVALESLGQEYLICCKRRDLSLADALILPGVGAFGAAMENLRRLDLVDELSMQVLEHKKPFLGICLGMQLLALDSREQGFFKGLGWIEGHVLPIEPRRDFRVPHVGWNVLTIVKQQPLFTGCDEEAHFYFDHSFHMHCDGDIVSARCDYGTSYVAALQKEHIFAAQFHPEKSQRNGLKFLRNFINFVKNRQGCRKGRNG